MFHWQKSNVSHTTLVGISFKPGVTHEYSLLTCALWKVPGQPVESIKTVTVSCGHLNISCRSYGCDCPSGHSHSTASLGWPSPSARAQLMNSDPAVATTSVVSCRGEHDGAHSE